MNGPHFIDLNGGLSILPQLCVCTWQCKNGSQPTVQLNPHPNSFWSKHAQLAFIPSDIS